MSYFYWSDSDVAMLIELSKKHTKLEAAKKIGCSFNSVKSKSRRLGISFKKSGQWHYSSKSLDSDIELSRALRDEGLTIKSIAEKLDLTIGQVRYYVSYRGAI